eukprot:2177795-Rhodomonas_salina.3
MSYVEEALRNGAVSHVVLRARYVVSGTDTHTVLRSGFESDGVKFILSSNDLLVYLFGPAGLPSWASKQT